MAEEDEVARTTRLMACIAIAYKFTATHKLSLRDILNSTSQDSLTLGDLVQMEADVLEGIDYEIPTDHTYAAMVRSFYESKHDDEVQD